MPYYPAAVAFNGTGADAIAACHTGDTATASGASSIGLGQSANVSATNGIALGNTASVAQADGMALGAFANAGTNTETIAIGSGANATQAASATGPTCVAIGSGGASTHNGARCGTGTASVAIGGGDANNNGASCTGSYSLSLGHHTVNAFNNSVALGAVASVTANNQIMLGTSAETVNMPGAQTWVGNAVTVGAWTAYTPTWTSSGTAPALGNGTLSGRYARFGRLIVGTIFWQAGTTTTFGTGNYFWALPVAPSTAISNWVVMGGAKGYHGGSVINGLVRMNGGATSLQIVYPLTWPSGTETNVGQLNPYTWASTDTLDINFMYEAAS